MHAVKKLTVDRKLLQEFVPLNALSSERFKEVSDKIIIEEVLAGRYLFRKGDRDNQSIYLLEGKVNLIDGFRKVTSEVEAGTDMSRYAISSQQPRQLSARAVNKCIIARIDSGLLDVFLTWDQSSSAEGIEIGADDNQDWMTRILQTEAFIKIPPAMIQSLLIKMQSYPVKAGEVVIRQGDAGDYFYTIHEGRCLVTRKDAPDAEDQFLAELREGTSFGEDALVSDAKRNATVTMLTDGQLMRLAKEDFIGLLKNQLVKHVNYDEAAALVGEGAVWVDVRTVDEYKNDCFEDSVNIPLASLRNELSELVFNTKYVMCCDTGRRSESAGFLLSHKGFDVYVLEGGIPTVLSGDETPEEPVAVESVAAQPAAVIASDAVAENSGSVTGLAEHSAELDKLQTEKQSLLTEIEEYRSSEVRTAEQVEQLRGELGESGDKLGSLYSQAKSDAEQFEQLRAELGESGAKLAVLYAQVKSDAEERQLLQDQYAALQEQHAEAVSAHEQQSVKFNEKLHETQEQVDVLREESGTLQQNAADHEATEQEIQQLQETLAQASERVSILESDVVKSDEAGSALLAEIQEKLQQQQQLAEQLQQQLLEADGSLVESREAAAASAAVLQASESELQEALGQQAGVVEQLQDELTQQAELAEKRQSEIERLQQQADEAVGKLEQGSGQAATLTQENVALSSKLEELASSAEAVAQGHETALAAVQEQNRQLQQQLEELKQAAEAGSDEREVLLAAAQQQNHQLEQQLGELKQAADAGASEHEAALVTSREQSQQLEQQLGKMQAEFEQQQQALSVVSGEHENAAGEIQSMQQDNEKLRTELRETALLLDEQAEAAANQLAARQAAEEALEKQQAGWESERDSLKKTTQDEQSAVEELRLQLEQLETQSQQDKTTIEKEQQEKFDTLREQIEGLESKNVQLRNGQAEHTEELELAAAERVKLQQSLNDVAEEKSGLETELASFKEESAALVESSGGQLQVLQDQIEEQQRQIAGLEQSGGDSEAQIRDLQQEILQSGEGRSALEQTLESACQQHESSGLQLEQQAERIRELEQEHNESTQKAHEDLTRKNDNEKELQGQIGRQRKKLEQSSVDLKQLRDSSLADIDNIREELHAERKARDEERAEMAARQRELKEQLGAIAIEHESNMTNQSGAIEKARDAGREEEQERLHQLIAAQGQSEEQLLSLQQELQKAHAEIAELTRTEKDRRQVDVDMMQEQNQQAVSTITQLESQLRQLTQDRDTALVDQKSLREKMNALRGEVEVARGLINVSSEGQVEDPEKLRKELTESRKNIAIALRLRAEAEAARDKLVEERNVLRDKLGEEGIAAAPLNVPELDTVSKGAGGAETRASTKKTKESGKKKNQGPRSGPQAAGDSNHQRRWLGAAIGLGVVGAVALVIWLLVGTENPMLGANKPVTSTVDTRPDEKPGPDEKSGESVATAKLIAPARTPVKVAPPVKITPPVKVPAPVVAVPVAPVVTKPVEEPLPVKVVAAPEPVVAVVPKVFQDSLKGSGKGPVMVKLPTAEFEMGSPGNSLNFDESPRHKVMLKSFSISKFEVTFSEYDKFARATGRRKPYDESWGRGDRPVVNVSWNDARAYAAWLSKKTGKRYRLPTESEWEYAARAGSTEKAWWDSKSAVKQANCFNCGSEWDGKSTAPAGSFSANAFGLHDTAGNAQEWTEDCYHTSYSGAPDNGSAWLTAECTQRVVRGGSYTSPLDALRNARRSQYNQDVRLDNIGFRVVRSN
jgi:formylglycine-generating enzyme required for sulfatase activity/CRP-like cAMP-binding protein/rhodanese-related sulfurtransferase/chromosome segregation ATPase